MQLLRKSEKNLPYMCRNMADKNRFDSVKYSGLGRESSKYGIEEYLSLKTIVTGNC